MRPTLGLALAVGLMVAALPSAAGEPGSGDHDAPRLLSLPGYEVSLELPAQWHVEPVPGRTMSMQLHDSSPFVIGMWRTAWDPGTGEWCRLRAYSQLGCAAPVDLDAELAGLDAERRDDASAATARFDDHSIEGAACVRHFVSDGVDIFEAWCCGQQAPADAWRSITDTLVLPAETRPARVAAAGRSLVVEAIATTQLWSAVYGPTIARHGEGPGRTPAHKRMTEPRVRSMVEAVGMPPAAIKISQHIWSDEARDDVLVVHVIRARGASTAAMRKGMLAWAESELAEAGGAASVEPVSIAGVDALRLITPDHPGATYLVADGDSAATVWGASDEIALGWLEALPCDYLDTRRIVTDALMAARPDD